MGFISATFRGTLQRGFKDRARDCDKGIRCVSPDVWPILANAAVNLENQALEKIAADGEKLQSRDFLLLMAIDAILRCFGSHFSQN